MARLGTWMPFRAAQRELTFFLGVEVAEASVWHITEQAGAAQVQVQAEEVEGLLRDLRGSDVDVATIGQYLQPTRRNLPVAEYVTPAQFDAYRESGLAMGFKMVFSGPFVRSSYMADLVNEGKTGTDNEFRGGGSE